MKKLLFTFYFLFFIICTTFAQSDWYWINPQPVGTHLNYIKFINNTTGFIVGHGGTILRTTDAGTNWAKINSNTRNCLMTISFANQTDGIIGGEYGLILKTNDAGLSWFCEYDSLMSFSTFWKDVSYFSDGTVYISENDSYIKKSYNGGINWVTLPPYYAFGMYFVNSLTGYKTMASSTGGDIEKTIDGGASWLPQTSPYNYDMSPYSIRFTDPYLGVITGHNGIVYYTINGGNSWNNRSPYGSANLNIYSAQFLNLNTGYLASDSGKVHKTTNAGVNWVKQNACPPYRLYSLDFIDANTGIAVGTFGTIARTTNGGYIWTNVKQGFTNDFSGMQFLNSATGFVSGSGGSVMKTTNGGRNWQSLNTGLNTKYFGVKFIDEYIGFVVGEGGIILRTTNGGINWTQKNSSSSYWLIDLDFYNNSTIGYAVGAYEKILKTTNGGLNWVKVYDSTSQNRQNFRVKCVSPTTAYVAGAKILKTTNSGTNWFTVSPYSPDQNEYCDLSFLNENTGFVMKFNVTAKNSTILRTENGGANWDVQYFDVPDLNTGLFTVSMLDVNTGYIAGDRGFIFKTTNGGVNWNLEYKCREPNYFNNPYINLNRIIVADTNNIYVVGNNGIIMKKSPTDPVGITNHNITEIPKVFYLYQNYPNPFNPTTNIRYQIANNSFVILKVYDILGKEIATLVNEKLKPGIYEIPFSNNQLPSGIYFYKLTAGNYSETKRMLMIK
jgi:photosystem II stability/assembly factor-like uncharacterized protein